MLAQSATRDFTVCWMPSSHREQGATPTRGLRAVLITVGAKSAGRFRIAWKVRDRGVEKHTWAGTPRERCNG